MNEMQLTEPTQPNNNSQKRLAQCNCGCNSTINRLNEVEFVPLDNKETTRLEINFNAPVTINIIKG